MITRLYSAALQGVEAVEVEVEVNARKCENPRTVIVGLPDAAVQRLGEWVDGTARHVADRPGHVASPLALARRRTPSRAAPGVNNFDL